LSLGAKVLTLSDSGGSIYDPDGIDEEKLAFIKELKNVKRGRISEYCDKYKKAEFLEGKRPWCVKGDLAFPCATQNEIGIEDAKTLVSNKCRAVCEGANMPTDNESIEYLQANKVIFIPGKAANAGGVAVSGLEMTQNSMRIQWSAKEVDERLLGIMKNIHGQCVSHGEEGKYVNYVKGANIAAFKKIADTMLAYGII
ncbi:MAG: glutamate dehydrogenase, partial [Lentisphaeraceae bacterium]|nr:glutamate dehydrogenase [Lentisphaeraceae bacterium]